MSVARGVADANASASSPIRCAYVAEGPNNAEHRAVPRAGALHNHNRRRSSATGSDNQATPASNPSQHDPLAFATALFPIASQTTFNLAETNSSTKPNALVARVQKRWANVQSLVTQDVLLHHVEILNPHTLEHQPNYASLAALSLYQAGADDDVIRDRVLHESAFLDPLPPLMFPTDPSHPFKTTLSDATWTTALGAGPTAYTDLLLFFHMQIEANGIDATVQCFLPRLLPGLSTFHPLIHLGAAVSSGINLLAAQALAFWAYSFCKGTPVVQKPVTDKWEEATVVEILQDAREDPTLSKVCEDPHWGAMEWHKRMRKIMSENHKGVGDNVAQLVSTWTMPEHDVRAAQRELAEAAVLCASTTGRVFPRNMDFPLTMALIAYDSLVTILTRLDDNVYHRHHQHSTSTATTPLAERNVDFSEEMSATPVVEAEKASTSCDEEEMDIDDETLIAFGDERTFKAHALRQFMQVFLACYISQGRPELHQELLKTAYPSRRGSVAAELDENAYEASIGGIATSDVKKDALSKSNDMKQPDFMERSPTPPIHERVLRDITRGAKSLFKNISSHVGKKDDTLSADSASGYVSDASDSPASNYLPKNSETLEQEWDRLCGAPYVDICVLQASTALRHIHTELSLRAAKAMRSLVWNGNWEFRGVGNGFKESYIVDGGVSEGPTKE